MADEKKAHDKKADEAKADQKPVKADEAAAPYPSQEEADRIKEAAATGSAPYATRDMKA